jgi:hypothetical protein
MASRFDEAAAQWDNNPGRVELARTVCRVFDFCIARTGLT